MRRRQRRAAAALAAVLCAVLAACTQPPRPFGRAGTPADSPLARPLTGTAVAVQPVAGMPAPLAAAVAEALADGLAAAEVPARVTAEGGLPGDHRLLAQVMDVTVDAADDTLVVEVGLELRDSTGIPVLVHSLRGAVPGALWSTTAADPDALGEAAAALAAPAVTAFAAAEKALVPVPSGEPEGLYGPGGAGVASAAVPPQRRDARLQESQPTPRDAMADLPVVEVLAGSGAPGDRSNNAVLAAAMRSILRDVGVPQTADAARAGAAVAALVTLTPVPGDARQDIIRVVWSVQTPDGREIGTVAQENMLPRGYAEQNWPDLAYLIAGAAVDGVVPLLRRVSAGS